ncbi:hypothetical protein HMPREF9597_00021 [Cutibacterium acnes HL005PA4]|nr:hypothetical protein HMPREF9567_00852 [Cutibacterium acnes HL013PA1]EFS54780.1 hypothetical protein HMPREF9589_00022 [Cutibacterium acnes HL059PA1]EFS80616.1 hypothetical protein HMPREF9597_00021 [Cutibacterium acnes HL005PA4]EFS82887.1 hypothetical protein HMPREF9598_00407 [Cutibacterium acnes HL050PA1]EFS84933.1 hypothetical protein HMPREF9600_00886 [Cutibacterium acnes HL050PA3]EFS95198.1 hypothetical protein HMPREF9608_01193 [Cutibacterium acnes HL067PA1]EFT00595.1 hypothetical protein
MAWGVCDINGSFAGQNPVTTRLSVRRCQWRCVDFAHSKCLRTQNYRVQMRSCRTGVYGSPRGDANEAVPPRTNRKDHSAPCRWRHSSTQGSLIT